MVVLCTRDLWFDDCSREMPQGGLNNSLEHEQQPGHTVRAGTWDDALNGHSLLSAFKPSFSNSDTAVIRFPWLQWFQDLMFTHLLHY